MPSRAAWVLLFAIFSLCDAEEILSTYDATATEIFNSQQLAEAIRSTIGDIDDLTLQMIDASGKIPPGLIDGNFFDLGSFDECLGIQSGDIYGKYCLGTLPGTFLQGINLEMNRTQRRQILKLHPQPRLVGLGAEYTGLHLGACVPSNMSAEDIPGLLTYTEDFCYSKATPKELSAGAIATIVILAIFGAIIVASTAFDIYLFYADKKSPHELLLAFSFLSNGRKIITPATNPDQLLCLNGIKAISMMWVVLGHEYSTALNAPISNFFDITPWQEDPLNMIINGATVSVDTFFVVGGLVTVYTYLKATDKGVKFNVISFYIHRFLRLTPALIIVGLIYMYLLEYLGTGPLWKVVDITLVQTCKEGWWPTLLYIGNYVKKGYCVPQTWYLSVDMQLFVLSPLVLIPLSRWPKIGLSSLGFLSALGVIVPFVVSYVKNLSVNDTTRQEAYMEDYYIQTHTRFGPYVIGMVLGYLIYQIKKMKNKIELPSYVVLGLWLVSLGGLAACVFLLHELSDDRWSNSLFLAFDRPSWAVALSGVIFLCVAGYGGPIDWFLSLPVFQFLTKVSYSMYLVHYCVITARYSSMRQGFKFSNVAIMHYFWGDFIFTLVLSVVLCLAFESPIIILEKHLFGRGAPRQKVEDKKLQV